MKVEHILWPTDFSELAQMALPFVNAMARRFSATVDIVHVIPNPPSVAPAGAPEAAAASMKIFPEKMRDEAEKRLRAIADCDLAKRVDAGWKILNGDPACAIVDYAHDHHVDLIILCSRGATGLARLIFGSVAEKVVRLARCPVLVIPPAESEESR